MNAVTTVEAGPERASVPQHPDAELFDICGVMGGLAVTWKRLHEAALIAGSFTPTDAAFQAFSDYVWPGYHAPDRVDLAAWLERTIPKTDEGRRARARAVLAIHEATLVTEVCHAVQHRLIQAVMTDAAGQGAA